MKYNLNNLKVGESGQIVKITGDSFVKKKLMDMGLVKGEEIYIMKVAPLGDPIEIKIKGYSLSIRKSDAEKIEVIKL